MRINQRHHIFFGRRFFSSRNWLTLICCATSRRAITYLRRATGVLRCASPPLSLIFSLVGLVRTRFAPRPDMARRERGANTERENFHVTSLWRSRCEESRARCKRRGSRDSLYSGGCGARWVVSMIKCLSLAPPGRAFFCPVPIFLPEVREFIKDTRPKTNTTHGVGGRRTALLLRLGL